MKCGGLLRLQLLIPIHGGNLDEIVGILPCRSFLLDRPELDSDPERMVALCRNPSFVPELASVEQLLARFRAEGSTLAIVVDEFGGTVGMMNFARRCGRGSRPRRGLGEATGRSTEPGGCAGT